MRYAQTSLFSNGDESWPFGGGQETTGWRSSPGATIAQCACGCGAALVPLAVGAVYAFEPFFHERYAEGYQAYMRAGIFVPAAAAAGVSLVGWNRGRPGYAFLGAHAGALALGGLGYLAGGGYGAFICWLAGGLVGSTIGYNLP